MSTMKKLFALVLALAMLMSVSVFAYEDSEDIAEECYDAVELLSAIGLIKGDNHGNFNPENTITRAEAAAIIYRLRNGGSDDASLWAGSEPFTDVADGEWYAGYIAWCYNYGIIDGVSATLFNPKQPIKGTELAKMLLATAGYKSDIEGYVGANWEKNVIEDATVAGLFDNYGLGFVKPAARQWAALMIVNALYVEEAAYLGDYRLPTGGETLGEKYLDLDYEKTKAMVVIANDTWSVVNGGSFASTTGSLMGNFKLPRYNYENERKLAETGKIIIAPVDKINEYKAGNITADEFYADWTHEVEAADDSIVGQEVKVFVKSDDTILGYTVTGNSVSGKMTITKDSKGMYTVKVGSKTYISAKAGSTILAEGIYDAQLSNIWLSDTTSLLAKTKAVYAVEGEENLLDVELFYEGVDTIAVYYDKMYNLNREAEFTAYDFDGDKDIDAVISNAPVYAKANSQEGQMRFGICNDAAIWNGTYWTQVVIDDYQIGSFEVGAIYKLSYDYKTGLRTSTKVDKQLAKVDSLTYDDEGKIAKVTIGGKDYTFFTKGYRQYGAVLGATSLHRGEADAKWEAQLGKLVSFCADSKGNLVAAEAYPPAPTTTTPSTIDTSKLAYLIDVQDVTVSSTSTDEWGNVTNVPVTVKKIKVMFADGTSVILTYDNDSKLTGAAKADALVTGKVYEYELNADGEIVLFTNLSKATNVYYGAATKADPAAAATLSNSVVYNLAKNRFGNVLVNDSTLIFVKYVDNKGNDVYNVMKISEFEKAIDGTSFNLVARSSSAISTALVATVEFAGGLPADPPATVDPDSYLIYVTSGTVKYNLGEDKNGNPINVAKFSAVDLTTGKEGDYYLKDVNGEVTAKTILTGEFNADGLIEAAPTTVTIGDFAGTLTASSWLQGKVVAISGDIILVDSTLIDKDNLAKNYVVLEKKGDTFTESDFASIKPVADKKDNNIVIKTDAKGKIVLVIYSADGNAAF